jgi:hypothetical protein
MLDPHLRRVDAELISDDLSKRCRISLTMGRDAGIDGDLTRRLDGQPSALDAMVSRRSRGFGEGRQANPEEGFMRLSLPGLLSPISVIKQLQRAIEPLEILA